MADKKVIVKVADQLFKLLESQATSPSNRPVTMEDADAFNTDFTGWLNDTEVATRRQELASAIVAEKWEEGFVFAIQILALLGAF